ncbi:MAG: hypothetical protein LBR66_06705 [Candidatus Symbiothrix sp.]|jgi:hypothetical protein|nr:hypothetical protein [Candidatus Symbiothrix sp.]
MKRTKLFYIALMALSLYCCEKTIEPDPDQEEVFHLAGTAWKLSGIYDMQDSLVRVLEPTAHYPLYYTLIFGNDTIGVGYITDTRISVELYQDSLTIETGRNLQLREDENGKFFYSLLEYINAYSYSKTEFKFFYEIDGVKQYLKYHRCGETANSEEPFHLATTAWKLSGIYDMQDNLVQVLDPMDCIYCYTIIFDTDIRGEGWTTRNWICIELDVDPPSIWGDKVGEYGDGEIFRQAVEYLTSYSYTKTELKFFYEMQGVQQYLKYHRL